jgi:signal transduction protein with GAF and PtsI domain
MNVFSILNQLSLQFKDCKASDSPLSREENKLLQHLTNVLSAVAIDEIDDVETKQELDFIDQDFDFTSEYEEMERIKTRSKYSIDVMEKIVEMKFVKGHRFNTIRHRYKLLTQEKEIYRFRDYINNGGTHYQKVFQVKEKLYERFKSARDEFLPVHDLDLKRWTLEIAGELGLTRDQFTASDKFIYNFKKTFKISSRKVN